MLKVHASTLIKQEYEHKVRNQSVTEFKGNCKLDPASLTGIFMNHSKTLSSFLLMFQGYELKIQISN